MTFITLITSNRTKSEPVRQNAGLFFLASVGAKLSALCLASVISLSAAYAQGASKESQVPGWDALVAAANKEGALVISGPQGRDWRVQLMEFQKDYPGIKLEVTPMASRDFWPRFSKERDVGQILWDLRVGGLDAPGYAFKKAGALDPIKPLLMLPEVVDSSKWLGGIQNSYLDKEKEYFFAFIAYETASASYNRKFASTPEDQSVKGLLQPKFKGKISMADPRGGASLNALSAIYQVYGEEFIRKLLVDQQPVITKEPRQQMDWIASGRNPIAFGIPKATFLEYGQRGVKLDDFVEMKELKVWTPGVGALTLMKGAPHPNAAKLFVNWLLKQETQEKLTLALKLNSRRTDVKAHDPELEVDAQNLAAYIGSQNEEIQDYQSKVVAILQEIGK
ncbi:MAG: extracellular solute-binding protein [Alphaproteobacteria bacterium]|nr:extracellular solute-binding protein [Alphaproteobacteria bacterium]